MSEKLVKVTLAVPRVGAGGAQDRGAEIEVSPAEARAMRDAAQIAPLTGAAAKAVADLDKAEQVEAAQAAKVAAKAAAQDPAAETATPAKPAAETAD